MPKPHHKQRLDLIDNLELDRDIFRKSFRDYVPEAFEVSEGGDAWAKLVRQGQQPPRFTPGWHIDAIADHLQAVAMGHIRRLLINIPPGTMKSVETCVLWPTWLWGNVNPRLRFIFSSYSQEFTRRDTRKAAALINSVWYQQRFPHVVLKPSPDTTTEHHTTAGGERLGAATNTGVTGKHVHGIVEDDPLKAQAAMSERARGEAWLYRTQALGFRLLPEAGWRVLIMQRLHEDDPSGRILAVQSQEGVENADGYVHLMLPMEFEPSRKCFTYVKGKKFFEDPRKEDGELLWPTRMDRAFVNEKKGPHGLGSYGWAGQGQQRPAPLEGGIIKRAWIKYYDVLPEEARICLQTWDMTFKKTGSSFIVGQTWAAAGANFYLVDQLRGKGEYTEAKAMTRAFFHKWRMSSRKTRIDMLETVSVEDGANGPAIVSDLRTEIPALVLWGTRGQSKIERLAAVSTTYEAGNVFYPANTPWVAAHVERLVTAPNITDWDEVDAATQALDQLKARVAKSVPITLNLAIGRKVGVLQP